MSTIEITVSVRVVDTHLGQESSVTTFARTPHISSGNSQYHATEVEHALAVSAREVAADVAKVYSDIRDDLPAKDLGKKYGARPLTQPVS